jgi:plasmid maintenance system antidote protein VapI
MTLPSPPSETIIDLLEENNLTAEEIGIDVHAPITPETALILSCHLGSPPAFWLAREAHYRKVIDRKTIEVKE